jgi:hypothetical protein
MSVKYKIYHRIDVFLSYCLTWWGWSKTPESLKPVFSLVLVGNKQYSHTSRKNVPPTHRRNLSCVESPRPLYWRATECNNCVLVIKIYSSPGAYCSEWRRRESKQLQLVICRYKTTATFTVKIVQSMYLTRSAAVSTFFVSAWRRVRGHFRAVVFVFLLSTHVRNEQYTEHSGAFLFEVS